MRAVLFDLDHTLFDTEKTERRALRAVAQAAQIPFGARALQAYRAINTHLWAEYRAGRVTSKDLKRLRFHLWLEKLQRNPSAASGLALNYVREFSSRGDMTPGAAQTVSWIQRAGIRLGVVTNGIDRIQRQRLRLSALRDSFSVVVTSERAGITKPDPRIIEIALKRLRVSPEDAAYVGDDPHVDGLAANGAGVRFVWFNPRMEPLKSGVKVTVDHQVVRLQEIRAVLKLG